MRRSWSLPPRLQNFPAFLLGAFVAYLYLHSVLPDALLHGLQWPFRLAHEESMSLSTYGKWLFHAPYRFVTDAFSGEFPTFYNYLSDTLLNFLAWLLRIPPMVAQTAVYAPALGFMLVVGSYFSILKVLGRDSRGTALMASAMIAMAGNSHVARLFNPDFNGELQVFIHVPFHTLPLANGQSLGWVLFLPGICLIELAHRHYRRSYALALGAVFGLLFHIHTLTFLNLGGIHLAYLVSERLHGARDQKWRNWLSALGLLAVAFAVMSVVRSPWSFSALTVFWITAMAICFYFDPKKAPYFWTYGVAGVIAVPFLAVLTRNPEAVLAQGQGNPSAISVIGVLAFYAPFWVSAALAYRYCPRRDVLRWLTAVLLANLFLGFNQYWSWFNHPYRFIINLIFPLSILTALAFRHAPRRWTAVPALWLCILMLSNLSHFNRGRRSYANIEPGTAQEAQLFNLLRDRTAKLGPQARLLNSPEFEYPKGVMQSSLLANYSGIPSFIPDYRYQIWRERYFNRLGVFCYLFPGYPAFEIHLKHRACSEALAPPKSLLTIKDGRLASSILPVYGLELAAAAGAPFAAELTSTAKLSDWPIELAIPEQSLALVRLEPPRLPGIAVLGQGTYDRAGFQVPVTAENSGKHWVLVAGRALETRAPRAEIDAVPLAPRWRSGNWALYDAAFSAGTHVLRFPHENARFEREADFLYFLTVVHEAEAARYLALKP